jgi:hypothetical protein
MVEVMDAEALRDLKWSIEDEVAQYVDEYIVEKLEKFVEEKIKELSEQQTSIAYTVEQELVYEIYKVKQELEEKIQMNPKVKSKSFWKWWK